MSDPLSGRVLKAGAVSGVVVQEQPDARVFLAKFSPRSPADIDALETSAWQTMRRYLAKSVGNKSMPIRLVESFIFRGSTWQADSGHVVNPGDWLTAFRCTRAAWAAFKSGAVTPDAALRAVTTLKEGNMSKKKSSIKRLRKALGIDMAGSGSTAANRQSNAELNRLIDAALQQTRYIDDAGAGGRAHREVVKSFDRRVVEAEADLMAAKNEFEAGRAREALRQAQKSRAAAKLVIEDGLRERGVLPKGRFGPNSADLFHRTTLTLPDDPSVGGI